MRSAKSYTRVYDTTLIRLCDTTVYTGLVQRHLVQVKVGTRRCLQIQGCNMGSAYHLNETMRPRDRRLKTQCTAPEKLQEVAWSDWQCVLLQI
jgi:hypothetical protein